MQFVKWTWGIKEHDPCQERMVQMTAVKELFWQRLQLQCYDDNQTGTRSSFAHFSVSEFLQDFVSVFFRSDGGDFFDHGKRNLRTIRCWRQCFKLKIQHWCGSWASSVVTGRLWDKGGWMGGLSLWRVFLNFCTNTVSMCWLAESILKSKPNNSIHMFLVSHLSGSGPYEKYGAHG